MEQSNVPESAKPEFEVTVDLEHSGVRAIGCLTFLFGSAFFFVVANQFFPTGGILSLFIGIILGLGLTYLADYAVKTYIPSQRKLIISNNVIHLEKKQKTEAEIDASGTANIVMWHFEAPRHPRVPKGWYVVANALEQDGEYIATYTITSPEEFAKLPLNRQSSIFERKKNKNDDASRDLRKAGQRRRIEQAEFHRGEFGAELTYDDYHHYLGYLVNNYQSWMPQDV